MHSSTRTMRTWSIAVLVALVFAMPVVAANVETGESVRSNLGMVSAGHPLAAQAGAEILAQGGNAVDAAVAVAFALAVVEPYASNVGGEGYLVISLADGTDVGIDFRSRAPLHANVHTPNEIGRHSHGIYTTLVPGMVKGAEQALLNYGTMSMAQVVAPAIRLAEEGIPVDGVLATSIADGYNTLLLYEAAAAIWLEDGLVPENGTIIRNPDLAHTMRLLGEHGSDVFYKGEIAAAIEEATDGWVDRASLAAYEAYENDVIRGTYRGYEVIGSTPIVAGVRVQQTLNILETFDIAGMFESDKDPAYIHLVAEALKLTQADYNAHVWDPRFTRTPVEGLISKRYAAERAALIDMSKAQLFGPGDPYSYSAETDLFAEVKADDASSTTHFGVLDKDGNAVSWTQTISGIWGSRVVIPGYGFLMSNHFPQFPDFDPNDPFRLDYAAPLKSTKTNLTPTIIKKDGEVKLIVGTPGGAQIPQTTVQTIVSLLDFEMDLEDAMLTPKVTATDLNLNVEGGFPEEVVARLVELGHNVNERLPLQRSFGSLNLVWVEDDGTMWGRGSYRRAGGASAPLVIEPVLESATF